MYIDRISKNYKLKNGGAVTVFSDFSLHIVPRTVFCLTGPSGCGKTTLLNLIAGLIPADSGQIVFEEGERGGTGFVFQNPRLLPWKTVFENCSLVCSGKKNSGKNDTLKEDIGKINGYLELAGLADKTERFPYELSAGERQRVSFVRALCSQAPLILMDEPFQNLDTENARSMAFRFFGIIREEEKSVVWVSHKRELIERYADRTENLGSLSTPHVF